MPRIVFWTLAAVTLAVYAVMLTWSLPTVSAAAGGLAPFDMRPGGYSHAEAVEFLTALTPDGTAFYRDVQQRLDIVFPALAGLTLFFALFALLPKQLGNWRLLLALPALAISLCDYLENQFVAAMLALGPDGITPDIVAEASKWTLLKAGTTSVVMTAILLLLIWKAILALRTRFGPRVSPAP